MTTVPDRSEGGDVEVRPALLDTPQPLGFLPTRRFWNDLENVRLIDRARVTLIFVSLIVLAQFRFPWWVAGLAGAASVVLVHGLLERCVRWAAWRRFRSKPALAEDSDPSDRTPFE
jgi:hypothetical protein